MARCVRAKCSPRLSFSSPHVPLLRADYGGVHQPCVLRGWLATQRIVAPKSILNDFTAFLHANFSPPFLFPSTSKFRERFYGVPVKSPLSTQSLHVSVKQFRNVHLSPSLHSDNFQKVYRLEHSTSTLPMQGNGILKSLITGLPVTQTPEGIMNEDSGWRFVNDILDFIVEKERWGF